MKKFLKKYLTQRNRKIISLIIIILGVGYLINYSFFSPTYVNKYIASNIYKAPANSAFKDQNFYNCVIDSYNRYLNFSNPISYTTNISNSRLQQMKVLDCGQYGFTYNGSSWIYTTSYYPNISSTAGLEKMPNLETIDLSSSGLTSIDLSNNKKLKYLTLTDNKITSLDLKNNPELRSVILGGYSCGSNARVDEDGDSVHFCTNTLMDSKGNLLKKLDLSNNKKLKFVSVISNDLETLDITGLNIQQLYLNHNNINNITISNNNSLKTLELAYNNLSAVNLSGAPNLESFNISGNQLTSLDMSRNTKLQTLEAYNDKLNSLNVSKNTALKSLGVSQNQLTNLDLSQNSALELLYADSNKLTSINLGGATSLKEVYLYDNELTSINTNGLKSLIYLNVNRNTLTSLNLSSNTSLQSIDAYNNKLTSVNLTGLNSLGYLDISSNKLTSLNLSSNTSLQKLTIYSNKLSGLDLSKNTLLKSVNSSSNELTSLNVTKNIELQSLDVSHNNLTTLDISKNTKLQSLSASYNELTSLDITKNTALTSLSAYNNNINNDIYVYKTGKATGVNKVKTASGSKWATPTWSSNNNSVATVSDKGVITTLKAGTAYIYAKNGYESVNTVHSVGITSSKYAIDEKNNVVFVNNDTDPEVIKDNIRLSHNEVTLDINMSTNKIYVKYGSTVLKEFNIASFSSDKYDLSLKNIDTGNETFDLSSINTVNCTKTVKDNKLVISNNGVVLKEIPIIGYYSDVYDLSHSYLYYINYSEFPVDRIKNVGYTKEVKNNKLYIKNGYSIVKSYDLITLSFNSFKMIEKPGVSYIIVDKIDSEYIKNNVKYKSSGVTLDVDTTNKKLIVKYKGEEVAQYELVTDITSDIYEIDDELGFIYIYGDVTEEEIRGNVSVPDNMTLNVNLNSSILSVTYNDATVKDYDMIIVSSDEYEIDSNGIYVLDKSFDKSNVKIKNADGEFVNNLLSISYNGKWLKNLPIVSYSSDKYDLSKDKIVLKGLEEIDLDSIDTINCYKDVIDNKLVFSYRGKTLKEINIERDLGIKFGSLNVINKNIVLNNNAEISYTEFTNNITTDSGYSYKIYNDNTEITSGNVVDGMILKIYYNDTEVYSYNIVYDYLDFDKNVEIDDDKKTVNNIVSGTTISDMVDTINTNGNICVIDKNNNIIDESDSKLKTGDKLKIELSTGSQEYLISIKGDPSGDGEVNVRDIINISDTIVNKRELEDIYYNASDYNGDGKVDVRDIIGISSFIVE